MTSISTQARAPQRGPRRVPVLLQLSAADCGAACLAMVLSAHGRATRVAECRALLDVGRGGVSARAILRAARGLGLEAQAYRLPPAQLGAQPLPAIAHWQGNHFVVVERWSQQGVTIVDPDAGRRRVSHADFAGGFSGVLLTFAPAPTFVPRRRAPGSTWRPLAALLRLPGLPRQLALALLASLVLQLLGLAMPLALALLVDHLLPGDVGGFGLYAAGFAAAALLQTLVGYARAWLLLRLQIVGDSILARDFFAHLLRLPLRFFLDRSSGDLVQRLASTASVREALTTRLMAAALDGGMVLIYLAILFSQAPLFGLAVLGAAALQAALMVAAAPQLLALSQQELAAQADEGGMLIEALAGIATIKAAGAEQRALERWGGLFERSLALARRRQLLGIGLDTLMGGLVALPPLLLLWLGAQLVERGSLETGAMLALVLLASACLGAFGALTSGIPQIQLVVAQLGRLADVMDEPPEQDGHALQPAPHLRGGLALNQVSFRYTADGPLVLRDLCVSIAPGSFVAVVGRTGSGKTTLARLLMGLYEPATGEIRYDDTALAGLDYRSLRAQLGVVPQEIELFAGTVYANIALSDSAADEPAVRRAAELAAAHAEISRLPSGYLTQIAEGGAGLPGGLRQRIALARALLRQPAILVLDEATSHLDLLTEQTVDQNLRALACTRIAITHRLSSVRHADLILVLDNGALVEQGRHDELMVRGGLYTALVRSQPHADEVAL